jgi:hypothetical protein
MEGADMRITEEHLKKVIEELIFLNQNGAAFYVARHANPDNTYSDVYFSNFYGWAMSEIDPANLTENDYFDLLGRFL